MDKVGFIKQMLQQATGITDEDFAKYISFPRNLELAQATPAFMKCRVVCEVVEAKYCTAGLKEGQKYVLQALPAVLLSRPEDCPPCVRALSPIGEKLGEVWADIASGNTEKVYTVECMDPGVEEGGLGHVKFLIRIEEVRVESKEPLGQ
jgi:uncharacterized repeat protein (TIGR04076 family)